MNDYVDSRSMQVELVFGKLLTNGSNIVKTYRLNYLESDNVDSDQIDLGIGEQTCGLALPMELLIGSSVGAGERRRRKNGMLWIKLFQTGGGGRGTKT